MQGIIVPLLFISQKMSLPPILDFIVAPGFLLVVLSVPCGVPPEVHRQYLIEGIIIGFMFNVAVYSLLAYALLRWRQNKALRLP